MTIIQTAYPADPKKMGDKFGVVTPLRKKLGLGPHLGLDFARPVGTPRKAVGYGRVVLNDWSDGLGHRLEIRVRVLDADGKRVSKVFSYDHLKDKPNLSIGHAVKPGDVIAHSGNSGKFTSGPHLHMMCGNDENLAKTPTEDPLPYIKRTLKAVEIEDE